MDKRKTVLSHTVQVIAWWLKTHAKQATISEDVDHAMDVRFTGEVEPRPDMSARGDDNVFGEFWIKTVVDVRALIRNNMVQI